MLNTKTDKTPKQATKDPKRQEIALQGRKRDTCSAQRY